MMSWQKEKKIEVLNICFILKGQIMSLPIYTPVLRSLITCFHAVFWNNKPSCNNIRLFWKHVSLNEWWTSFIIWEVSVILLGHGIFKLAKSNVKSPLAGTSNKKKVSKLILISQKFKSKLPKLLFLNILMYSYFNIYTLPYLLEVTCNAEGIKFSALLNLRFFGFFFW